MAGAHGQGRQLVLYLGLVCDRRSFVLVQDVDKSVLHAALQDIDRVKLTAMRLRALVRSEMCLLDPGRLDNNYGGICA